MVGVSWGVRVPFAAYLGIGVFAVSGALVVAKHRQPLVTFIFFATATGVGGGTLRVHEAEQRPSRYGGGYGSGGGGRSNDRQNDRC